MNRLFVIFLTALFLVSCDQKEDENIQNLETIKFSFNDETLIATFEVDEYSGELISIRDSNYERLAQIYNENDELIQHFIDDNSVVLFENEKDFEAYLEEIGTPLSNDVSRATPYHPNNLRLFWDCCYDSRYEITWSYLSHGAGCNFYFPDAGGDIARLKDFTDGSLWGAPTFCKPNSFMPNYPLPDNIMNSVLVKNVLARMYENRDYGGKSISLDARGGQTKGHRKLRKVRNGWFGSRWNNRISSIRLYN